MTTVHNPGRFLCLVFLDDQRYSVNVRFTTRSDHRNDHHTPHPSVRLIAFRVRGGGNPETSAQLLAALTTSHVGHNLAYALHYNGYVGKTRAESAAHDLEVEHADDQVRKVAEFLPFPAQLEADMGGNYSGNSVLMIDLGTIGGEDDPHQPRATWWIETEAARPSKTPASPRTQTPNSSPNGSLQRSPPGMHRGPGPHPQRLCNPEAWRTHPSSGHQLREDTP
ncbi:hypothetical protein DC31_05900 [Microbacterium sp. CH12i]|uniref:hypothetical protein n=1 Tax=Microbacterium sp. CH12i TaxID=1479651 RepID=UPI000460FA7C|nr:hypothetical protein [Microbacterium sp. CH12i]KDA04624.1 hypothetical protein DC31_05900 [Microbacterium sp. CH12i]